MICQKYGCKIKVKEGEKYCTLHTFKKKENKYNAVRQTYNGYNYDSKKEAYHAFELDCKIKTGEVIKWERQYKIELIVNEVRIGNYYIDFKVWNSDGTITYEEVKGVETMLWRIKWRLAKALNQDWNFKLIK